MALYTGSREIALKQTAEYLAAEITPVLERLTRTCLTCAYWRDEKAVNPNTCGKFNALPPPRIIAYGCPDYEIPIPF